PAPTCDEHRAAEHGLADGVLNVVGTEEGGDVFQWERMLGTQRQQHGIVARRRLELEIEVQAELLAQPEAEGPVDPRAERGVDDELHAAALVEEALEHDVVVSGQDAPKGGPTCV